MNDWLGELLAIEWFYRGWLYLISKQYRIERKLVWRSASKTYKYIDLCLSVLLMVLEFLFVVYLIVLFFRT